MAYDNGEVTVAQRLAKWALDLEYRDIPSDVIETAKLLILDQIGLQVRGATLQHVQPEVELVKEMQAKPEATITNTGERSTIALAAYANGTFGHSMEFDDCHLLSWHVGSVAVPTALAIAERDSLSGREVLAAVISGHQVMSTIGSVTTQEMMTKGWHAPKTIGGFAAAAVAARLLGETQATLSNAFGIASSDASGVMEYDQTGGEVKRHHAGAAARSGIESVLLARYGLTGPTTTFEGKRGIFFLFGGGEDHSGLEETWNVWHLRDTMFRLSPGVGTVLPALDVVADLKREHQFDWQDVTSVDVGMPAFSVGHGGHIIHPEDAIGAHFSLAFAVALRIVTGESAPEDYVNPAKWSDPAIQKISELVRPYAYEFPEDMPLLSAHVKITLADGTEHVGELGGFYGSQFHPATREQILTKFHANVDDLLTAEVAETLVKLVDGLEDVQDVGQIVSLIAGNTGADVH